MSLNIAGDCVLEYDCSRYAVELRFSPGQNIQTYQRLAEHPERDYKAPNSEEIELIANNYRTTKHQKTKHDEGKICMYTQEMSPATSTWPTGYRNAS